MEDKWWTNGGQFITHGGQLPASDFRVKVALSGGAQVDNGGQL